MPLLAVSALLLSTGADILPHDALVAVGPVQLTLGRLLILAGLTALLYTEGARAELFRSRLGIPVALLLLAGLAASLKWDTAARYRFLLESVALFYLTLAVVRSRPGSRRALAGVALVALSLSALTGVAQVSQDQATGFYRDGCLPVTAGPPEIPPGTLTRATGSFANPNLLAAHVLLLAPLGAVAAASAASLSALRLAVGLAVALGYVGLLLTYSRAAVFMALIGLGVALAASGPGGSARGHGLRNRAYLAGVVVALAIGSSFLLATCGSEAAAGYGRAQEWRDTAEVIGDNPVLGVGLGRLGDVLHARDERSTSRHAHNLLLNWWAEAGPAALAAWLWILALLLWRSLRGALAGDAVARGALVALTGFAGLGLVDHPANADRIALAFWVVAAIAAAGTSRTGGRDRAGTTSSGPSNRAA